MELWKLEKADYIRGENRYETISTKEYLQNFQEHKALCSFPGMLASEFWVVIYMNR